MLERLGSKWQELGEQAFERIAGQLAGAAVLSGKAQAMTLDPGGWTHLCNYLDLIVTWNSKLDITAARDNEELMDVVVADAFVLACAAEANASWVDVGAGVGAPGAALALLRSDLTVHLVEPQQKRVAFLRALCGTVGLPGLDVERARADELPPGGWHNAVSRATFEPGEWLACGAKLAQKAVWVLLARAEPPGLPGWALALDMAYSWPLGGSPRRALKYVRKIP